MKKIPLKNGSTVFLRCAVLFLMLFGGILYSFVVPELLSTDWVKDYPTIAYLKYPIFLSVAVTIIPFMVALIQALKLLKYIDTNKAFSQLSVQTLRVIKYCAASFALLCITLLPLIHEMAQKEDAPGMIIILGGVFVGVPTVVAVSVGVLQKLLENVIAIKSENDLTV